MFNDMWADYPFPLISTPAVDSGYTNQFVKSASKMALVHNVIIRGMNAMYLQCEYVTPRTAHNFLTFCQCWSEMLHNHHECEEVAYFPVIEKAAGIEGIAETNVEQHDAFMGGLNRFDAYVYKSNPFTFSGARLLEILDSFAAALQMHLTDEVVWILSLSKYPDLDLASIDVQHGLYVKAHSSKLRLLPYLLTNHDLTYEDGIHSWWPTGNAARDWFLRYVCTMWHKGAWEYSACGLNGKPRKLKGIADWGKLEEVVVETAGVEMIPQRPEKAWVKIRTSNEGQEEDESGARSPRSSTGKSIARLVK